MMGTMSMRQPENWLYEIWQKGHDSPCYVMVPNAKDLVKSHLMIAVREEVEVLKEKISELMDKINQLEVENTILKANMSQETLQQLQMQTQLQITGGTGSGAGNNMIAAPPSSTAVVSAAAAATAGGVKQQSQQQQSNAGTIVNAAAATATVAAGGAVGGGALITNSPPAATSEMGAVNESVLASGAAAATAPAEGSVDVGCGTATNGSMC